MSLTHLLVDGPVGICLLEPIKVVVPDRWERVNKQDLAHLVRLHLKVLSVTIW